MKPKSRIKQRPLIIVSALLLFSGYLAYKTLPGVDKYKHLKEEVRSAFNEVSELPDATLQTSQLEVFDTKVSYVAEWNTSMPASEIVAWKVDNLRGLGWTVTDPQLQDDGNAQWFTATKNDLVLNVNAQLNESNSTDFLMEIYSKNEDTLTLVSTLEEEGMNVLGESTSEEDANYEDHD